MRENLKIVSQGNVYHSKTPKFESPEGRLIFLSNKTGTTQLWKYCETASNIEQITFLNERVLDYWPSPSGEKLVIGIDIQGDEKQQLKIIDNKRNDIETLIHETEFFHTFGCWSPCENKVAWASNRGETKGSGLYIQDVKTKKFQLIYLFETSFVPLIWLSNDKTIIVRIDETNIDHSLYLVNIEEKTVKKLSEELGVARYNSLQISSTGENIYLLSDLASSNLGIYKFSTHTNDLTQLIISSEWDIEEFKLSSNEERIIYVLNEGGYSKLYLYDVIKSTNQVVDNLPKGVIKSISWADKNSVVFEFVNNSSPRELWKYNLNDKNLIRLTYTGSEGLEKRYEEPKLYFYESFDGLKIPYFYYENRKGELPTIIYIHGGPESQYRPEYNPLFHKLYELGYSIAAPNIRGSTGYGRDYIKLDDTFKRKDALKDIIYLREELISSHNNDEFFIMGHSYGGFSVLLAISHYPKLWKAGIDVMGVSHLTSFLKNTGKWRKGLREYEYGKVTEYSNFFDEIAPLHKVKDIEVPLLIVHGINDTRVPYSESVQMVNEMEKNKKEVLFESFQDEGHFLEKDININKMNYRIVEFIRNNT